MTINLADNDPRVSYSVAEGVTQTSFTVSFEFFDEEDLNVYVDGTLKTLTTDYTVTGGGGSTGSVSISVTGATGGSTVVVTRSIDLERTTDFPVSGAFNIASLNTELDRFVAINADLKDQIDRSLKLSDYDNATSLTLPDLASRKGKSLVFNSTTGDIEVGPSSTALNSIADYIPEINTVGDDLNAGSYVAGGEYDFGSITDASVGTTGSPDGFIVTVYNNLADITAVAGNSSNVNTVASISANVTTVAGNNANVTTVAGNISNVNTVAGISSNVTTVSGISSDVTAVAADATDIGTVATNIASVNTVATNIADVITVANDLNEAVSEVVTVADDLNEAVSEIDTVANSISNVDTVGTNISNVNTVAGISANVTTVAGNSANVTTVAGISSDVTTVATNNANVTAVAGNATNINTVAGDTADINALGPISANITTVAGVAADVTTVAGISANTTTVAGISADVTTVAGNSANVTTVAGISSDVTTVAGDSADIQTVATNLSSINDFADKYRIGATDPTTGLDEGDLFYNTTSDTLKVYNGTAWEAGVTAGSGFLATTGGSITGSLSVSDDLTVDTNTLHVDSTNNRVGIGTTSPERALHVNSGTGNNVAVFQSTDADARIEIRDSGSSQGYNTISVTSNEMYFATNNSEAMRINSSGVVTIGDPLAAAYGGGLVVATQAGSYITVADNGSGERLHLAGQGGSTTVGSKSNHDLRVITNDSEVARFDTSGNLMIGGTNGNPIGNHVSQVIANGTNGLGVHRDGGVPFKAGTDGNRNVIEAYNQGVLVGGIASVANTRASFRSANTVGYLGVGSTDYYGFKSTAFVPTTSASYDLGGSAEKFKDGYFSGTVNAANFNTTSDATLKTNVETLTGSLDAVKALRGVSFDWIESGNSEVGVIAQEVEAVVPDVVSTNDQGIKSVKYGNLVGVLIEAIKEQQQRIEALEAKLGE